MHQTLGMRLPGDEPETAGPVPSPRVPGKQPRSWLSPKLSDGTTQWWLEEDAYGHGAHSNRQVPSKHAGL